MAMCIFLNCTSVQKPFCSLAFFSLPKDHRRKLWIENSGNAELANLSETARRVVCQKHFSPHSLRIQFHRTTLSRDAVPEKWDAGLNDSIQSSVVEPIEIAENDDYEDDPHTVSHDKILPNEIDCADDYESHQVDDAEGIEFVEIEDNSEPEEYVVHNTIHETDQPINDEDIIVLEDLPLQPATLLHEIRIEKADMTINKPPAHGSAVVDTSSMRIAKQNPNKPPDELMELSDHDIVHRHDDAAAAAASSDIIVSSSTTTSKSIESHPSASMHTEDEYFALSMAGILKRISPQKRAFAKVNILRYLTELEYGIEAKIN